LLISRNFTQQLNKTVYTMLRSFVEIRLKITKLCRFNQDNWPFLGVHFITQKANYPEVIEKNVHPQNSTDLNPLDYHIWNTMREKYHKLQPKPMQDDRWVESRPGKSYYKNTSTRRWRTSPSTWLPTWLCLPMVVTMSIWSNSEVCIPISSPTNQQQHYMVKTMIAMLRNVDCLGLNNIILLFSDIFQQNLFSSWTVV